MSSGQFFTLFKPALVPALLFLALAIPLAAPAVPQLLGGGMFFAAATALEGKSSGNDDGSSGQQNDINAAVSAAQGPISISNKNPRQGEVVEVKVAAADLGSAASSADLPTVDVLEKKYKLFPLLVGDRQFYRALFAVPVVQKPGTYKIVIGPLSGQITVKDAHFQVQRLSLPSSKNNFITAPGEEEAVDKAKATLSAQRLWTANFVKPSHARTSAPFGIRRIVNGKLLPDYFHSGLDFAGALGSPIYATAPGTVILAQGGGVFKLHGNMVAIDHGQGVVSFYIHMHKVLVKVGQAVKGGEQIGLVGQTGRANGPHLHFSIYCNHVASSPSQWFSKAP